MHMGIKSSRRAIQRWFKTIGVTITSVTAAVTVIASGGASSAANADQIFVSGTGSWSQSIVSRTSAGRMLDPVYRLIRAHASHMNSTHLIKSGRIASAGKSVAWFALAGTSAGTGAVNSYDAKGNLTVARTGLDTPFSVAVDKSENVYVGNSGAHQVLVYKAGAITPSLALDDSGFLPFSVSVNARDGSVAVGNLCHVDQTGACDAAGNTAIYKRGATEPSLSLNGIADVISVAYDSSGNLWMDGATTYGGGTSIVGYYDSSPGVFHVFPIKPLVSPGTITFDAGGNLDVLDGAGGVSRDHQNTCSIVSIFKPGNVNPLRVLTLGECLSDTVTSIAVDTASSTLWGLEQYLANLDIGLAYSYPTGKSEIRRSIVFPANDQAYGVAVKP